MTHDDRNHRRLVACGAAAALLAGCYDGLSSDQSATDGESGAQEAGSDAAGEDGETPDPPQTGGVGPMGMRRLSVAEIDRALFDLVADDTAPATEYLKEDVTDPFDNDFQLQIADRNLIESLEQMTTDVVARLVADPDRFAAVVGCEADPAAPSECLVAFLTRFGRRALRRPLDPEELDAYVAMAQAEIDAEGSFVAGAALVLRAILQDAEFVYRVEIGEPSSEPRVFRLGPYEIASRIAFLAWGTPPDDDLLDRAAEGGLATGEKRRAVVEQMLDDARARDQIERFHMLWLGYRVIYLEPELVTDMRTETRMLLDEIVFEQRAAWLDVFAATGTYVNDALAQHYGLPSPGSSEFAWVEYGDSTRRGLLGHGTFLSVNGKFGDTSPIMRGKFIRERLFCTEIPLPDQSEGVDVDQPPPTVDSPCKFDRYSAHRVRGTSCEGCHVQMDPIGFGLENYDQAGRYRTTDQDLPQCTITGEGELEGSTFTGPAGLAALLVEGGRIAPCAVNHLYRYAMGRKPATDDLRYLDDLTAALAADGRLDRLLLELVADDAFAFRREEEP